MTEPTQQQGIPAWRWVLAGLFALAVLYLLLQQLMTPAAAPIDSRIEPVPDRLKAKAERVWIVTERNRECLNPALAFRAIPCYYAGERAPLRSIMELK